MSTAKKQVRKPATPTQAEITAATRDEELARIEEAIAHQEAVAKATARLNAIEAQIAVLGHAAVLVDRMDAFTTKDIERFYSAD